MPERLRVLHVLPSLAVGGAEQMAAHLMIGLSGTHDVGVVGLAPAVQSAVEIRLAGEDIAVWHLNKPAGFEPRMYPSLHRVFREFRPHVIHTHLGVQRYVFPVLLKSRIAPAIHTMHNLAEHETDTVGRLVHWFAFRSRVLPVAISQKVSASVKRIYGLDCKAVIPNCIPIDKYRQGVEDRNQWRERHGLERDAVVFTCVGRLEPQKNPFLLLESFAQIDHPRAHLLLLGKGALGDQLAEYARSHHLSDRVHLMGKRDNIPSILAASDVFVLASNWEGNPLAVMEAMAAGLPVVSTAVGGVPELVESGAEGLLVPPGDRAAFASALKTMLENSPLRFRMAEAAANRASREFRLERMVQGYAEVYKQTVASFRGTSAPAVSNRAAIYV